MTKYQETASYHQYTLAIIYTRVSESAWLGFIDQYLHQVTLNAATKRLAIVQMQREPTVASYTPDYNYYKTNTYLLMPTIAYTRTTHIDYNYYKTNTYLLMAAVN